MRLKYPTRDEMSQAQLRVVEDAIAGKRGTAPPPLMAWLASPELAQRAQKLGEFVRYDTSLPPPLSELAILVTARFWTSHYEWYAHKRIALKAGIDPLVVDAIARRLKPKLDDPKACAVYAFSKALHETHAVPAPVFAQATRELGRQGVAELVGLLGYYTLVSMTLNAFEIGLPEGETSELEP
ncbi:MAG: carboxymuconolactone decarboxylase family protein [Hyphomicrobiales bacterium]